MYIYIYYNIVCDLSIDSCAQTHTRTHTHIYNVYIYTHTHLIHLYIHIDTFAYVYRCMHTDKEMHTYFDIAP